MSFRQWAILVAIIFGSSTALAQKILSDEATAALWTVGPHEELYAAFGHSALRITDPVLGFDRIYNFGTFDFSTPNFYFKFIRGDLDYFLSASIAPELIEEYRAKKQLVVEQQLDLTSEELDKLFLNMEQNLQPENAAYRYDFVHDNCTTRIRDAIARVVNVEWKTAARARPTLRDMVQPYVADRPAIQTGINLLFGSTMDHPSTTEEAMFLPYEAKLAFEGAEIAGTGGTRKLVRSTTELLNGPVTPGARTNWLIPLSYVGAIFAGVATWQRWKWFRRMDCLIFCSCGLIGCLLVFLQFGTRHWVLHENWNLLWAWPTHLIIWFFRNSVKRWYWLAALGAAVLSAFFLHPAAWGFIVLLVVRAWSLMEGALPKKD